MTELDDLRARVAELEAERERMEKSVREYEKRGNEAEARERESLRRQRQAEERLEMCLARRNAKERVHGWTLLEERLKASEARVRVQAEQIAALQEALKASEVYFDRALRGYTVGDARERRRAALEALALAEGCAAPADEEEK